MQPADRTRVAVSPASVDKEDLPSQIHRALAHDIVTHRYLPGQKLTTQSVASQYGVSVTPVREAFKRLASEGLMRLEPRVGTRVANISLSDIRQLYEIRELIETFAVRTPFRSATLTGMRQCVARMGDFDESRIYEDFDLYWEYSGQDAEFHRLLVAEKGYHRLSEFYTSLHTHWLIAPVLFGSRGRGRAEEQRNEHLEIVAALEAAEATRAESAVRAHLRTTLTAVERNWSSTPDDTQLASDSERGK